VASEFRQRAEFAGNVAMQQSPAGLSYLPVVVGTIHSVKGAEAEVLYLFPNLGNGDYAQYQNHGPARDAVICLF
jgi:hypothetical protein